MKKFCVSKNCNACGECVLQTALLIEDDAGYAIPTEERYIRESELDTARNIVASCPMHALSIIELPDVELDAEKLSDELERRLKAVVIPDISRRDITYNEKEYSVEYGYVRGEGRTEYSSRSKAEEAGREQFRQVFWNRRKDFALNCLAQYKSKTLRKFFDFSDPRSTHYAEIGMQMETILKDAKAKISAQTNDSITLPEDFTVFQPELDAWFQKMTAEKWDGIDAVSYVDSFFEGFDKDEYHRRQWYEDSICSCDEVIIVGTSWWGGDKTKTTYGFCKVNTEGANLVDDIRFWLGNPGRFGLRAVDDFTKDTLDYIMKEYRSLVAEEIAKKVKAYRTAISKL